MNKILGTVTLQDIGLYAILALVVLTLLAYMYYFKKMKRK